MGELGRGSGAGVHFQHCLLHLGTISAVALVSIDRSPMGEEKRENY